jgi:hypothetical protein
MARSRGMTATTAAGVILLLGLHAPGARAQLDTGDEFRFTVTPYAWLPNLNGHVGLGRVNTKVDLSTADVLNALDFGIMGTAEVRRGAWLGMADGVYSSLGKAQTLAVRGATGFLDLGAHQTIIQPALGYVLGDSLASLDLLGGARYWHVSNSLELSGEEITVREGNMSRDWVDATVGARARVKPFDRVRFVAAADIGGGGSHLAWQWYTSLGYDVWQKVTLGASYRALDVDYDHDHFLYDTRMEGFVLGATFRSW